MEIRKTLYLAQLRQNGTVLYYCPFCCRELTGSEDDKLSHVWKNHQEEINKFLKGH